MNQPAATSRLRRIALRRRAASIVGAVAVVIGLTAPVTAQEPTSDSHSSAGAQEPATSDAESAPAGIPRPIAGMAERIQYVGPDTYILLDEEGRSQPVPGMTYEDFLAAWKQSQQSEGARRERSYSIEAIDIVGHASDGHARLRFTARVHLLTDGAVEVPLGLLGAIHQGHPEFGTSDQVTGAGVLERHEYLHFNPERGGFIVHFEGRSGERREVTLDLIVPLTRDGVETTLPLNCPRALASTLELTVDRPVANAIVSSGTLLASEATPGGGTRLNVAGAMGSVRLTWHEGDSASGETAAVLGAAGAIRVSIDGRGVRSDARVNVRSYGGSFDRFRVRLPAGAQLVRDESANNDGQTSSYRITVEDDAERPVGPNGRAAPGRVVLVQFSQKQQRPTVVELSTEQPIGLENGGPVVELGGFEVLGAVRQYGDVAVEVGGDWQARWDVGNHVRQVDPSELDAALQPAGLTAAFQYDRQPWSLGVRITPRQFRIHVTPRYELEVLPEEARLTVRFAYQVFGTRAFEFHVGLKGWQMREEPIDSGGLVDQDRVHVTPDDTLVLPLAQSSSRRAEITFSLRRPVPREERQMRLPLPVPLADSVGTGELEVASAAEVELLPDLAMSAGLTPTPITETTDSANGPYGTTHRFRTALPQAVFVAQRISRAREVLVEAAAQFDLQEAEAQIDQRFDYTVRYEPIKELRFEIPSDSSFDPEPSEIVLLAAAGRGDADTQERETSLTSMTSEDETDAAGIRQLRVTLPQPRMGQFAVRIRRHMTRPQPNSNSGAWHLPLIQQADGRMMDQQASIHTPRTIAVSLDAARRSSWTAVASPARSGAVFPRYQYASDQAEMSLPLIVREVDRNLPSATIVERVWLQTWSAGEARQARAAFRFRSTAPETAIELPPQVPPDEVEVLIDGRPADVISRGTGRIIVRRPHAADSSQTAEPVASAHTLELRYRQPARRGLVRRYSLTPPQIVGTTTLSDVYWQIVLPGDQQIVRSPSRMTAASQWQWLGSFWGRRPVMAQTELENWVGASAQLAPVASDNQYLFSSLAPLSSIEIVTAPRWLIVLAASSAVLTIVLVWVYIPVAQRGWIMAALALSIGGLAIAFPAPALLLAQAAGLGVVVAMISVLISRMARRPTRWPIPISTGSSQRQTMPRGDSILMPSVATAASTAPTAPFAIPDAER
jgi:hypothetical protein